MAVALRAQAAMEYLVTYGWALLALMFVVAFLVSSGAFSSSNFSVQECIFQPDFPCSPFILYKEAEDKTMLRFTLTNGLGFPINITNVSYITTDMGGEGRVPFAGEVPTISKIGTNEPADFTHEFRGSRQPQPKDFRTVIASITYQNCRRYPSEPCTGNYTTSGRISAVVESMPAP